MTRRHTGEAVPAPEPHLDEDLSVTRPHPEESLSAPAPHPGPDADAGTGLDQHVRRAVALAELSRLMFDGD